MEKRPRPAHHRRAFEFDGAVADSRAGGLFPVYEIPGAARFCGKTGRRSRYGVCGDCGGGVNFFNLFAEFWPINSSIMKEITLQVRESEYEFLLKLLRQLEFVNILNESVSSEKMEVLRSIRQGLEEVRLIRNGQLPRTTLRELLEEED